MLKNYFLHITLLQNLTKVLTFPRRPQLSLLHLHSIENQDQLEREDFPTELTGCSFIIRMHFRQLSNCIFRSSSMHDLARVRMDNSEQPDGGVKWKDEQPKLPNIGMPGLGTNGRTLSTKSLHMLGGAGDSMMWNNGGMWGQPPPGMNFGMQAGQGFHPMMGGWGPVPGMMAGQMGAMR